MKKKLSARQIFSVITFILVVVVVWNARENLASALDYLTHTNIVVILLLIPEQLLMYYSAGQMFFSYMAAKKDAREISKFELMRISLEMNFVVQAVPSGGVSGIGYSAWRLKQYGVSAGQTSFMYVMRYAITTFANQAQTLLAIIALLIMGTVAPENMYVLGIAGAVSLAVIGMVVGGIWIAGKKKVLDWLANRIMTFVNWFVSVITFGHKQNIIKGERVKHFCDEISIDYEEAKQNKSMLKKPILWGFLYSFLEVATYWIIAISMGHPELLPQIMVGEAVASVLGAVFPTPGGAGGYEVSMAAVMWALGVDLGLATAVVVTTRVIVLVGTIVSGYGFYQHALSTLGKEDKKEIEKINKDKVI